MKELVSMMEEIGFPWAYDHFAEGESPDPPFALYLLPGSDNFSADSRVYYKISQVRLELYTETKDIEAERTVERVLEAHDIYYEKTETWIASEKLFEVLFIFEGGNL